MNIADYNRARQALLQNRCQGLLNLEKEVTDVLINALLSVSSKIKDDFDSASHLRPFWEKYAPLQRGHKPRGEAFPWGEVGEKVVEGYLYSLAPKIFDDVRFIGLPYGHDVRFTTGRSFLQIDVKSTGPDDDNDEIVSSPNQVSGTGEIDANMKVFNDSVPMAGPRITRYFLPELPPFYIMGEKILPTLTFYLKVIYSVQALGNQPLEYLELICVPNGLAFFAGPKLINSTTGILTPGKDETGVVRKRTRIKLNPLARLASWRCQKIMFDQNLPYVSQR